MDAPVTKRTYGITLVTVATVFWSTAGFFVRALDLDVWSVAAYRSLFASLSLLLIAIIPERKRLFALIAGLGRFAWVHPRKHAALSGWDEQDSAGKPAKSGLGWPGLVAIPVSALSMFAYIAALKLTTVANVLTVYATVPFVAAGLAFLWTKERAKRRVLWASAVAVIGIAIMASAALSPSDLAGNALALLMTVTFGIVLVMVRRFPTMNVALVNGLAAALCAAACWPMMAVAVPTPGQLLVLGVFGFVTTAIAYLMFLTGGRYIPSGEAGLIGLLDVVLGPLWVWLAFAEQPSGSAMIGAACVLAAVGWYLLGEWRTAEAT